MTTIRFISPDGQTIAITDASHGQSVMKAALQSDVRGIEAECGGSLTCATCHVYVHEPDASRIAPPASGEIEMLEFVAAERRPTSRLSCQIVATSVLERLEVHLPAFQVA